jgi:hypothetical protein
MAPGMGFEPQFTSKHILRKTDENARSEVIRQQAGTAVIQQQYDWQVARMDEEGRITFEKTRTFLKGVTRKKLRTNSSMFS